MRKYDMMCEMYDIADAYLYFAVRWDGQSRLRTISNRPAVRPMRCTEQKAVTSDRDTAKFALGGNRYTYGEKEQYILKASCKIDYRIAVLTVCTYGYALVHDEREQGHNDAQ